ncbi:hypothetical protein KYJ26_20250 [Bacillus sp. MCCB 382]|uniref:hypothetical protein n=1 Tax=Bacillus sp. MCCB 382 TaxID=2860197 RepID=UPI001C5642BB|nr:hypothetical protein [Bacillus sp. MCCB 382]
MSDLEVFVITFFGLLILLLAIVVLSLIKGAEKTLDEVKKMRRERNRLIMEKESRKYLESEQEFKKGQVVKSGHYSCRFIVIGYKYDNYILAIREGEEDKFTNRELLHTRWLYTDESEGE